MEDRRKLILLSILCVCLAIIVIALASALGAKTLPRPPTVEYQTEITTPSGTRSAPSMTLPWEQIRLPSNVRPVHYNVHMWPNLTSGEFRGEVDIDFRVLAPSSYIIVHVAFLEVTSVQVRPVKESRDIEIRRQFLHADNEVYVIEVALELTQGDYVVHIKFTGSLIGSLVGFYRSSYVDSTKNVSRYLATTKFEPTYARRAFPCFDEPDQKATFQIRLTHEPDMIALSNMNIERIVDSQSAPGLKETVFNTSVPMPTYLVAFVICDFKFTVNITETGKEFKVYSRPDQVNWTNYALSTGTHVQDYYENYFNIPYPLPKQDMIAVPDFASGAMENWGLISYRETLLLYDETKVSTQGKRNIADVIAHELTHQWFGNLVTMKWWDDLWLNEGFATFFAYEGMAQLEDDWKNWRESADFLLETLHVSLHLDSSIHSHPIVQPVHHPDEITAIFDRISYKKGASIIRMLEAFIGKEVFRTGLIKYLKKFAYGNAKTEDLWQTLTEESSEVNVTKVMTTWTHQMGYPVIYVEKSGNTFTVKQTRFLDDPSASLNISESPFRYLWEVPLTYRLQADGTIKKRWMHLDPQMTWVEPDLPNNPLIKFNVHQTGVYRVNYDSVLWESLIKAACVNTSESGLSIADLTNLLDDAYAFFYNGMLPFDVFFRLCKCLPNHPHYEMWQVGIPSLGSIANLIKDTPAYALLRRFTLNLIVPMYNKIGWQEVPSYRMRLLQKNILTYASDLDYFPCLKTASEKLILWLNQSVQIPVDQQSIVFSYGLRTAPNAVELWEEIWSRYLTESSPQTKMSLLSCLASTTKPWLIRRLLESVFNETEVRSQDAVTLISMVASNPSGTLIAWHFYRENWDRLVEKFSLNDRKLGNLIQTITSSFTSSVSLSEMKGFFKQYPNAGAGERPRNQAITQVKANIKWIELRQKELLVYLKNIE